MNATTRPLTILIVDDWPDSAESLADILRLSGGHQVKVAYDGAAAICLASAQSFDVVLLDLEMPRLDGCQVAEHILALPGEAPLLIAVSGFGEARHRESGVPPPARAG